MNTRRLLSTLTAAVLLVSGSALLSACTESLVADGLDAIVETTDSRSGKQIERYFLPVPPPTPGETPSSTSTASDSTSTNLK